MAQKIPKTMKALVTQSDETAKIEVLPVPEINDDEVLVKVVAVALNPTDWKHIQGWSAAGTIQGCDWAGNVVKVGKNVTSLALGDPVAGFVEGGKDEDRGAFAEYVKSADDLCWKIPKGTISYEEAATLGCSFWTAVQVLFTPTRLGLVEPPSKTDKEEWLYIHGGSGSVGRHAIRLAHLAGYKVVTTASPKNHELCKSLGADAVFDYKDPSAIGKIKEITKNSIRMGLDAMSEEDTEVFSVQTFGPSGGKLIVVLAPQEAAQRLRPDVEMQLTLVYTTLGREVVFSGALPLPASPEDRAHMAEFLKKTPELVKSGQITPGRTRLFDGGIEGINAGLKHLNDGKVSGEKIVLRFSD